MAIAALVMSEERALEADSIQDIQAAIRDTMVRMFDPAPLFAGCRTLLSSSVARGDLLAPCAQR